MQKFLLIITVCLLCTSCGVKDDPEYKSQNKCDRAIHLV